MAQLRSTTVFNYAYSIDEFRDDYELNVAEILLQLPQLIHQRETHLFSLPPWGSKRRRSAINASPIPSPSTAAPLPLSTSNGANPFVNKKGISSPQTPLCFLPSESECPPKHIKRPPSLKKTYEKLKEADLKLSTQNAELKLAIKGVLHYHRDLKAKNQALNDHKTHLQLKFSIGNRVSGSETTTQVSEKEKKPTIVIQTPDQKPVEAKISEKSPYPSSQIPSSLLSEIRESVTKRLKKNQVPDLNFSADLSLYQPLDLRMNDAAVSALARKRRYELNKEKRRNVKLLPLMI